MTWLQLAEHLKPYPDVVWDLAKQCGVTHAVTSYPDDSPEGHGWEPGPLRATQRRFRDAGLELAVIETGFPWLHDGKVGGPNAEDEIALLLFRPAPAEAASPTPAPAQAPRTN